MYRYNHIQLSKILEEILQSNLSEQAWLWLKGQAESHSLPGLYSSFTAVPRHTGKLIAEISKNDHKRISNLVTDFTLAGYTTDRLARIWLLLKWPAENKENYVKAVNGLFKAAEMNEQVALYGALPLLAYPEEWITQCTEGIRSNIGTVLQAIMCNNPYPASYLSEPAWNQLVLKAFFTEKPINQIIGLDERANRDLAYVLSDYAHERWAANRTFDPQLWRLTGKFIDERLYPDIKKIFFEGNPMEKKAAALACYQSEFAAAKVLLDQEPAIKSAIKDHSLSWNSLAHNNIHQN